MTTKITSANITQSGTSGISSVAWQAVQTTGFTAVAGRAYPCNTTSAAFTVTLPASPAAGNVITLTDYAGTWGTNALTVNPNGNKVNGSTASGTVATSRGSVNLVYIDSTQGWISFASNLSTSIVQAITATGGDEVKTVGAYKYHIFTSSGTFTVTAGAGIAFEVMAAGGGGGGGGNMGGGGGGGELDLFTSVTASASAYTVMVGNKGNGQTTGGSASTSGGFSLFALGATEYVKALGGGRGGGSSSSSNGGTGGSGGGADYTGSGTAGGASGSNTNIGGTGNGNGTQMGGGGGGGAGTSQTGGAGNASGSTAVGGSGGTGYTLTNIDSNLTSGNFTSFSGMTVICSGGGGGALNKTGGGATTRGVGGTGAGSGGVNTGPSPSTNTFTSSAATAFGCGGGGGGWDNGSPNNVAGADGYAGIVIIRYAV